MSATQSALQAAREAYQQRNAFDSLTHNMLDDAHTRLELSRAQLACWQAGECCGCQGADGRCLSRMVELQRHCKLLDGGMGRNDAAVVSTVCEHSEMASLIEITFRALKDNGSDEPLWLVAKTLLTQKELGDGIENDNG